MKNYWKWACLLALGVGFVACSDDDTVEPEINEIGNIDAKYEIGRSKLLVIDPNVQGFKNGTFTWTMNNDKLVTKDSIIGNDRTLAFVSLNEGKYDIRFIAKQGELADTLTTAVYVAKEVAQYSAYIAKVFDFLPAIGQYTNDLPTYVEEDSREQMRLKAEKAIVGPNSSMVSLGGYGGYVTFGFDHTIVNVPGKRDFRVKGNAFWAAANPNPNAPGRGGSCEPGIIMVAYDKNKNGNPDDDEWYEIAGSEYYKKTTIKNYEITYHKPDLNKEPVKDPNASFVVDAEYSKWVDNQGNSGYKVKNSFHQQNYFPDWIKEDKITFKGTLLPNNAIDESGTGSYWVLYSYPWGYADNAPNNDDASAIDINWAVDNNGKKVNLPGIDFVKVYTGVNQEAGWLGEVSTEVAGAEDLHLLGISIDTEPKEEGKK